MLLFMLTLLASQAKGQSFFFNATGGLGPDVAPISAACYTALNASIACDESIKTYMTSNFYGAFGNATLQNTFCADSCGRALLDYKSKVGSACASDPQPFPGLPATFWANSAISVHTLLCLRDAQSDDYCTDYLNGTFADIVDENPADVPKEILCADCVEKVFKQIQSTPYSNYDPNLADQYTQIQSICGWSNPTTVPGVETNVTTPGGFAEPYIPPPCLSGETYKVVSGDNCLAIAHQLGVSSGSLITLNSLLPDCTNLLLGQDLCIPPRCTTYTVQPGDACSDIASSKGITFPQLVGWNPTINNYCTNLIAGHDICVSPPGGAIDVTAIPGATVTKTAVYASTTVAPPGPVATGTTRDCGKWYQVQPGDFCQLVALNFTIDLGLFLAINPSLDENCSNLLSGVTYCVQPTANWNSTDESTTVSPPAPTPSGTTDSCYEYYVVQVGDWCGRITDVYGITFAQLQFWNPDILDDCSNLLAGDAYCVHGATDPPGFAKRTPAAAIPIASGSDAASGARQVVHAAPPSQTPQAIQWIGGGVPHGWPGLSSPRFAMGQGALPAAGWGM